MAKVTMRMAKSELKFHESGYSNASPYTGRIIRSLIAEIARLRKQLREDDEFYCGHAKQCKRRTI